MQICIADKYLTGDNGFSFTAGTRKIALPKPPIANRVVRPMFAIYPRPSGYPYG